jgi:hypothetical protein
MQRIVKKCEKKQGDVAIISFIFSGTGNIHSIEIPDLKLPASIQLYGDPEIKEDFEFNDNGADGKLTIDYNLQMLDAGKLLIPTFEFSYFDLETEKYITSFADSIYFEVIQTPGFDRKKAQEEANKRLTSKKNKKENQDSIWSSKFVLVSFGAGLLALSGLLLLFFRKRNSKKDFDQKIVEKDKEKSVESKEILFDVFTKNAKFDLIDLETKLDSPSEYIKCLSEKMETWLNEVTSSNETVQLSRLEKLNSLVNDSVWRNHVETINSIFQKIDEARYGLPVDTFYCKQIQEKLVEIFRK